MMPEDRQLEARALAAREAADLLEDVVAAEQEAGEVAAGLARRHRDLAEQRVEDRLAGQRVVADLGEVAELDVGPEGEPPVARRELPGDHPQERRLAGAVRADDPDPLAARGLQADGARDVGAARVADDEVLDAQHDLAGARRPASPGPGRGAATGPSAGPSIRSSRASRASCSCIFPCLRWLRYVWTSACSFAISALAGLGVAAQRARRAPRAGGRRPSSRRGRPSGAGRAAPRRASRSRRGRPGRARRRAARRDGAGRPPRATRSRRGRGGSSARRAAAGRGRRRGGGRAPPASAGRPRAPPASGRSRRR